MITYQLPLLKYYVVRLKLDLLIVPFGVTTFSWINAYWDLLGNNIGGAISGVYDLTNPVDLNQAQTDFAGIFFVNIPPVIGTCTITIDPFVTSFELYYTSNNPVSVPQPPSSFIFTDGIIQIPIASNIQ